MSYDLYASLLKMHDTFRPGDAHVCLRIDFGSRDLARLRKKYDLPAIAGEGNAFDRAVRMMDWLTTHVRHNGNCNPKGDRCAMTALDFAFDQPEKGVNCAWLATTLTEMLLALGIPARTVYIYPFAPYDCDNHVVAEVWTGECWVMLDPTCNCYARDAAGQLLGVMTLRAALADRQEISFNETLRYNGSEYSHEAHRDYLAKDLFYFRLQEHTGKAQSRFVTIAPEGYDPHRRDLLNIRYRLQVQGDQPWLRDWRRQVEKSQPVYAGVEALMAPPQER